MTDDPSATDDPSVPSPSRADSGPAPHAVLVGVGPGMGASLARTFAAAGYDVTLVARTTASLAPVAAAVRAAGRTAREELLDVGDLRALATAVRQANDWRPISLLHHNASMDPGGLLDADIATLRASVDVNALAAVVAAQAALPGLVVTGGRVTWTGGGIALSPRGEYGVLALGKAALRAAGLALAQELAGHGIALRMLTVNGFIRAGGRFDPDRIAAAFWAFVTDPDADVERIYDGRS
ncbi:MAG: SDR family NAD(P)-dependent oxidoreductase [Candidatus Nanopelagicales bacterium]